MNQTEDSPKHVGHWRADVVRDFAQSELFDHTFREGMSLVEETAAYLDGPGRQESKRLDRPSALGYASESMRLTTRLMQVASWLLVQRAVREGQMEPHSACEPGYRLASEALASGASPSGQLPIGLIDLLDRSERLYDRVMHLDKRMYLEIDTDERPNPVMSQFQKLQAAFGV